MGVTANLLGFCLFMPKMENIIVENGRINDDRLV